MPIGNYRKKLQKKGVNTTFSKITQWTSFGNYALNWIVTGNPYKGIPNSRTGAIAGPQGSGKSFLFGNIIRNTQELGYKTVYIDTENAIDDDFLSKLGVDLDEDWFLPITLSTIEELTDVMSELFKEFEEDEKIAIFVDSMSNLETEKEKEAFEKGELSNDMGLLPKKMKQFVKNMNNKIGMRDMFFIYNLHVYDNQDMLNGEGKYKISGGNAQMFIPSWSIMLDKLNLKDGSEQIGIKMKATTKKTRYNQLGLKTEIHIPWDKGMDPYFGLIDILETKGLVDKKGAWYSYEKDGETVKFQKKDFEKHADHLMEQFDKLNSSESPVERRDYTEEELEQMAEKDEDFAPDED